MNDPFSPGKMFSRLSLRFAITVVFCSAGAELFASADIWVVDSAMVEPYDFTSLTDAVAASAAGDVIQVRSGLGPYEEHVIIAPPPGEPADHELSIVGIPDSLTQELPEIQWAANLSNQVEPGVEIYFEKAVIEIHNEAPNLCPDLRVSILNLAIHGLYEAGPEAYGPGAISVNCAVDDTAQAYETRIEIAGNELRADRAFIAALALGAKDPDLLYNQSVIWGDVRDNDISNHSPDRGDGISSHHFIGRIEKNRITSNSEGMHVGYGYLDPERHSDPPTPAYQAGYFTTSIFHNAIVNCLDEGIHFTQASRGEVYNNIVARVPMFDGIPTYPHVLAWPNWANNRTGIFVGNQGHEFHGGMGLAKSSGGVLEAGVGEVIADVYNNVFSGCQVAVKLSTYAELTLQNNIISRTVGPQSVGFLYLANEFFDPPVNFVGGYNLFTPDVNLEYGPEELVQVLQDPTDISGGEAYFEEWLDDFNYSFMLQDTVTVCHPAALVVSEAIDQGNPAREFNDNDLDDGSPATAPAHGGARNDIGPFGGPHAIWDDADACAERTALP